MLNFQGVSLCGRMESKEMMMMMMMISMKSEVLYQTAWVPVPRWRSKPFCNLPCCCTGPGTPEYVGESLVKYVSCSCGEIF